MGVLTLPTKCHPAESNLRTCTKNVLPGERLVRYTTWKVGGPADILGVAHSVEKLCCTIDVARRYKVPWIVLGRGSNVLIADEGVAGLVVLNRCTTITIDGTGGKKLLERPQC